MIKPRIPETNSGIQGEFTVANYDKMQRVLRDRGWMETRDIIESGITGGHALEVGHGPGYLGLEWLKQTNDSTLTGLDISPDMQSLAGRNAAEYGFGDRVEYKLGNAAQLPFDDESFDAVFSNGSLHEWEHPEAIFDQIWRVLKPGGRYFVSDMRRDMGFFIKAFLWLGTKPKEIRPGLLTSIGAAYTPQELSGLIERTNLKNARIKASLMGLIVNGQK